MRYHDEPKLNAIGCVALVLGQTSLWMGGVVAMIWSVLAVIIAQHVGMYHGEDSGLILPVGPPIMGLALAGLGLILARLGRQSVGFPTLAGLVLNAEALALALAMLYGWLG